MARVLQVGCTPCGVLFAIPHYTNDLMNSAVTANNPTLIPIKDAVPTRDKDPYVENDTSTSSYLKKTATLPKRNAVMKLITMKKKPMR